MRRILYTLIGTLAVLVMLFSYHTSRGPVNVATPQQPVTATSARPAATTSGGTGGGAPGSGSSDAVLGASVTPAATTVPSGATTAASGSGTYTGNVVDTRYGPVQVEVTLSGGKITAAKATQFPDGDHRSQEINAYAVPELNTQATTAQSAQLDGVSGATFTSEAYKESLQSAIDASRQG